METEGPYRIRKGFNYGVVGPGIPNTEEEYDLTPDIANMIYAEGRKAAESYTEKMIKLATDEVRKCHEEIRRLEDKYARNFYIMPISLDEESAKKARGIE